MRAGEIVTTSLGWTVVGFVGGVATASAAFIATPSLVPAPTSPSASTVQQQTPPPAAQVIDDGSEWPGDQSREPGMLMNDPLSGADVTARIARLRWVAANPAYEFVVRDYCGCHDRPQTICPEFEAERIRVQSDYPYSESHDYNGDGHMDFALILAQKGKEGPEIFLLFNGPFGDGIPTPAFRVEGLMYRDHISGDFLGPPESDNGYSLKAKGATYELVYMGNPG